MVPHVIQEYSRIYLSFLLEYLRTNRINVEINDDRLINHQSASKSTSIDIKNIINIILDLKNQEGETIESARFIEYFIPPEHLINIDGENDEYWVKLNQIHLLEQLGAIDFTFDESKKKIKSIDKKSLMNMFTSLKEVEFLPVHDFMNLFNQTFTKGSISRFNALLNHLKKKALMLAEYLERERIFIQDLNKFSPALPVKPLIKNLFEILDELKVDMAKILKKIEDFSQQTKLLSRGFSQEILTAIDPILHFNDEMLKIMEKIVENMEETDVSYLEGKHFLEIKEMTSSSENTEFIIDLILFLIEINGITRETKKLPKKEKNELRRKINALILEEFIPYLKKNWPMKEDFLYEGISSEMKLSAVIPKLLKKSLEMEEKKLMALSIKEDLMAGKQEMSEIQGNYSRALMNIGNFINELVTLLPDEYKSAINPLEESLDYQQQDLTRFFTKMEFFFQETQTQEEKVKIREEIQDILDEVDELIASHEKKIGEKLKQKFLELDQLLDILQEFKVKYNNITIKLNSTIKKYDAYKLITIINDIKNFMEKRNATIQLINNMVLVDLKENFLKISRMMRGIRKVIQNNTNISIEMGEVIDSEFNAKLEEIEKVLTVDPTENDREDEMLIKKELSMIEARLSELSVIKNTLEDKRDRFLFKLLKDEEKDKFIQEKKIGECIICYNPISSLDEEGDIIQCPHCHRIGHYLCLAFWLEKYNICPVCHGKLISPENPDSYDESIF